MTVAKVVRVQVDVLAVDELDHALAVAADSFAHEPGTLQWVSFRGAEVGERVLIELFRDQAAVAEHDASSAVERLIGNFTRLSANVVSVEELSNERDPAAPYAGE